MINKITRNKELLFVLVVTVFLTIFFAYIIFNILDMVNPVFTEEEYTGLSPQLQDLLAELEKKFK